MITIRPETPGGFPEFLPAEQMALDDAKNIIKRWFERFGFAPIETPAVELKDVLTAKGSLDKQIYSVSRLQAERNLEAVLAKPKKGEEKEAKERLSTLAEELKIELSGDDDADRLALARVLMGRTSTDMALHFDLTVPLARYVAGHQGNLTFPLRRYQMQKVWRGERQQSGRFREFYQCDIDVIGRGSLDPMFDAEIPSIIYQIFSEMQIGRFLIRISNAKILEEYLLGVGVPAASLSEARSIIDELEKVGTARTVAALVSASGIPAETAEDVVAFLRNDVSTTALIERLQGMSGSDRFAAGVAELSRVIDGVRMLGVPEDYFKVDLTIARGLDYYTGTVYETTLVDHPGIGSICSGGRYDDLASYFTDEKFPGVGISIGLTRLISRLLSAKLIEAKKSTPATVLVTAIDRSRMGDYLKMATSLRRSGINCEVYFDNDPLGKQLRYANRKGFFFAVIAGEREFAQNSVQVKTLTVGGSHTYQIGDLVENVRYLHTLIGKEDPPRR